MRRRFQIHLSTAVALMVVAGGSFLGGGGGGAGGVRFFFLCNHKYLWWGGGEFCARMRTRSLPLGNEPSKRQNLSLASEINCRIFLYSTVLVKARRCSMLGN